MESQPHNPDIRINSENFYPCNLNLLTLSSMQLEPFDRHCLNRNHPFHIPPLLGMRYISQAITKFE